MNFLRKKNNKYDAFRVRVFETLTIHLAMRMRHIVISGLPRSTNVFPHYLINGKIFEKKKKHN
jgi:hypothetical protein